MSARAGKSSMRAVTLFFVAVWAVFQFAFPYHLAMKERYDLFLAEGSWIAGYFQKPAPLSFLAGDWLTQFFLIPGVAALITLALLVILWDGFRHLFASFGTRRPALWALLPVAAVAFILLSPEVPLALLIGTCFAVWLAVAILRIPRKPLRYLALAALVVLLIPSARSLCTAARIQKPGLEREYDYRIYFNACLDRWDKVEIMGARNPYESIVVSYYYNIALARKGQLPEGLLKAYQPTYHGLFIPVKPGVECFRLMASTDALYLAGDYAQAQHSAMLGMTFSPRQRSAAMIKALSDIAFANGDYDTARRYLKMLSLTALYKKWAREGLQLLDTEAGRLAIKNDCRDILVQHNDYRMSLANIAATSSDGKTATDYLLCLDLLDKDLLQFRQDYDHLYKGRYDMGTVPVLYQEALLMTFDADSSPADQLTAYGISRTTLDNCTEFLRGHEKRFPQSYWFYHKYAQPAQ
ncbi:MAG: hypothetical protein IJP77_02355 [Bacteroidales bacterium]|nr:hypothetical protein [Bacteroidales bacterium]